ncbi:restriction endonuclease [Vibrio cholerae]
MYKEAIYKLSPNDWEWFAQDVLFHLGFTICFGPSEGVDDGVDMIVEMDRVKYLVSCKHNFKTKKNVGVRQEADILDRLEQHGCEGFIVFYSVGATTGLKKKLTALENKGIRVMEIYLDSILDIIPTMRGYTLQKYFERPQELYHHVVEGIDYTPLTCMHEECDKDILSQERIPLSLAGFHVDENDTVHFLYGCKHCVADYCNHPYWAEIGQIRYIEQMQVWCSIVNDISNSSDLKISTDFYQYFSKLQQGILQIQIPQGWGRWL